MDNLPEVEWSIQGCRLVEIDIVYIYIYNIYKLSDQKTSFVLCAADQSIHDRITSHIIWFSLSNNTSVYPAAPGYSSSCGYHSRKPKRGYQQWRNRNCFAWRIFVCIASLFKFVLV